MPRRAGHADGQPDAPVLAARPSARTSCRRRTARRMRVRLLGEDLIAFRDTTGKVGLIQNNCPHRGASLFFGRNEEDGLRCVYHGWKFDVAGSCVDMPNEPAESRTSRQSQSHRLPLAGAQRHHLGLHGPARDAAAAAGPRSQHARRRRHSRLDHPPAVQLDAGLGRRDGHRPPGLPALRRRRASRTRSRAPSTTTSPARRAPRSRSSTRSSARSYGAYRPAEEDTYYWRIAHMLFPFYTMIPTGMLGQRDRASRRTCRWTTSTRCTGRSRAA